MTVATLTVGSASNLPIRTITFNDFESMKPISTSTGLFFADYAYGGGTEIKDSGVCADGLVFLEGIPEMKRQDPSVLVAEYGAVDLVTLLQR
mgnify:CR=1 FL=1